MDELSLRALRTVTWVERTGSLSRTAVELGMAQSAVSRHLAEVEARLGGPLFYRTGRGVTPTDLAGTAMPRVRELLAKVDALTQAAQERAGAPAGEVTIGLVPSLAGALASALWAQIEARRLALKLRVREGYSGDIEAALAEGRIDLAVVNRYRTHGANRYRALFAAPLCLIGRPEVLMPALATSRGSHLPQTVGLADGATLPLVLPLSPNALRSMLLDEARRAGLSLVVMMEAGSATIIKRMLRDHVCATVLPQHAVADELATGQLAAVPFTESGLRQQVVLATSSQHPFTRASKAVATMIPGVMKELMAPGSARR